MKKRCVAILLVGVLLAGMCLTGCQTEQNISKENQTTIQESELLADMKEEYYMLSVSDYECDLEAILEYLIEDYGKYKKQIEFKEYQVETSDAGQKTKYEYTIETGGPAYRWELFEEDYMFQFDWYNYADGVIDADTSSIPVKDTEGAIEIAKAVAELMDADLELYAAETAKSTKLVEYVDFRQTYDGVPLAYGACVKVGRQELYSPSVHTVIDGNGLCMLNAFALLDVGEPVKRYHSKEFISLEEVERRIQSYCTSFHTNNGNKDFRMTATVEKAEVVYIPTMENNEKVLIPAYELVVIEDDGKDVWKVHYIVDVFTGYVYYRAGFEQIS